MCIRDSDNILLNAAIFKIDTDDEIVVQQQAAGRTVYQLSLIHI